MAADSDRTVVGSVFDCVGKEIEEDPFELACVNGNGYIRVVGNIAYDLEITSSGHFRKCRCPVRYDRVDADFCKVKVEFAAFVFPEIENLVNQTAEDLCVFGHYFHQGLVARREIWLRGHLR